MHLAMPPYSKKETAVTTINMKLVEKARSVPLVGLLDQGRNHAELEVRFRDDLHAAGWRLEDTNELLTTIHLLDTQHAQTIEARADSKADRRREQNAIDDAKAIKRRLVIAFHDLYADDIASIEDLDILRKSGQLRRSTARISAYLGVIRKPVEKYDEHLKSFFNGESALAILDSVKAELDAAQSTQEVNLATLPLETLKVYELKGRLLALIEKMNRRGKIAFDGQAHIVGLFNKDLILRARQIRRSTSAVEPVEEIAQASSEKDAG